jgi:hypothetical protein
MQPTFVKEIPHEDLAAIAQELERQPIGVNHDRRVSGAGRSQAFGIVKRMSYRPWVSRNCWTRPHLWKLLQEFADKHVEVPWKAVQVNVNYESKPHRDKGNQGESFIVGFGEYTGGDLVIHGDSNLEPGVTYDTRYRAHSFNGSELLHSNRPHVGNKYSLVFFDWKMPAWWDGGLPTCKVIECQGKLWLEVKDVDGAEYLLRGSHRVIQKEPVHPVSRVGLVSSDLKAVQ